MKRVERSGFRVTALVFVFVKKHYILYWRQFQINLQILWVLSSELDGGWVHILSDSSHVLVSSHTSSVHLLWVDSILWMQVLNLTIWENSVDKSVNLELGTELGEESEALLLAGQLQQVWSLTHDGSSSGWHLKDLLLLGLPGDHVELLNLCLTKKTTYT